MGCRPVQEFTCFLRVVWDLSGFAREGCSGSLKCWAKLNVSRMLFLKVFSFPCLFGSLLLLADEPSSEGLPVTFLTYMFLQGLTLKVFLLCCSHACFCWSECDCELHICGIHVSAGLNANECMSQYVCEIYVSCQYTPMPKHPTRQHPTRRWKAGILKSAIPSTPPLALDRHLPNLYHCGLRGCSACPQSACFLAGFGYLLFS